MTVLCENFGFKIPIGYGNNEEHYSTLNNAHSYLPK